MKHPIEKLLNKMGITLNGQQPYDIQVHDRRMLNDILFHQSMGAGESYMNGLWDCEHLDQLFFKIFQAGNERRFASNWTTLFLKIKNTLFNQQSRKHADEVSKTHYDIDNRLYELMLGKSMAYTCGYWKDAASLDKAQFAKYDLICKKLDLQKEDKVLELGCGWGGLAKFMAENYHCEVHGFDIGNKTSQFAKEFCKGLPVTIYQCDYRETKTYNPKKIKFDKLVSVGVLEHVGYKNYGTFLKIAKSMIKNDGLFLLHSIGRDTSTNICDPWIDKYIFPNGMLPSIAQVASAAEYKFKVEDLHNFGAYYDKTLMAWHKNLNDNWPALKENHSETFKRMMNYYLLSCAGAFRARSIHLWQFILTPKGILNGYQSIR